LSVGLVIERSLVRLPAGSPVAIKSTIGQLSLPSLRVGKSSTGLYGWGQGGVCSLVSGRR